MKIFKMTGCFVLAFCVAGFAAAEAKDIQIKGSDTIVRLTMRLAEVYMEKTPGVKIAVSGGGSGAGIAAIINQTTDIADASREMKPREMEQAAERHVDPRKVVVAVDAIAVIVHADNPVAQLTVDQVGAIFRGDIQNWKDLGGADMPIALYGRPSTSGTFSFLRDLALRGEYSPKMAALQGNAQIISAVQADRSGIGYVGVAFAREADRVKALSLALVQDQPFLSPLDRAVVASGAYPLTRPLIQYVNGEPLGALKDFIDFELSPEGQRLIEEEGFFSVPSAWDGALKQSR